MTPIPLGEALAQAIDALRDGLGDPRAPVAVLTPSAANGQLARQSLARQGGFIRVEFLTPERLAQGLGAARLAAQGLRPEPPGWLRATVGAQVRGLAAGLGPHGAALARPGWRPTLVDALSRLEGAGATVEGLRALTAHGDRLGPLATLLEAVQAARAEAGLFGAAQAAAAALAAVHDPSAPANRARAVVVLGDRALEAGVFALCRAWIGARPARRVAVAPLAQLPPAPLGLWAAAGDAPAAPCTPGAGRVGALQAALFGEGAGPLVDDGRVQVVRTPDPVRDAAEAARAVRAAVREGVPLDRIAVALPDAESAEPLAAALAKAGIPATWLTGPPLARTPAARLLLLWLQMAAGARSLSDVYELLRHPSFRLNGATPVGRGRWRKILAACGAGGGEALADAVAAWVDQVAEDAPDDRAAGTSLQAALQVCQVEWAALDQRDTLAGHARRWRAFCQAWVRRGPDTRRVLEVLEGWLGAEAPPRLSLAEATAELADALSRAPAQQGRLSDPAVLVAEPMALLGGDFLRVFVLGLGHGRFPRKAQEDALLTDAVVADLAAAGLPLADSAATEARERRRLAFALSAARDGLWLSVPRFDANPSKPRPVLPGALARAVVTALQGRRATHADLEALPLAGSRADAVPEDAREALGALHHRISRLLAGDAAALRGLAQRHGPQRLLHLHRALTRVAQGGERDGWTGRIDPAALACPGLDGEALPAHRLARLIEDPQRFLMGTVLGAWPAKPLAPPADPTEPWPQADRLRAAAAQAVGAEEPEAALWAAWTADLEAALRFRPEITEATRLVARQLAELTARGLLAALPPAAIQDLPDGAAGAGPWQVAGEARPVSDAGALLAFRKPPGVKSRPHEGGLAELLAARAAGLGGAHWIDADGRQHQAPVDPRVLDDLLAAATARARAGLYPPKASGGRGVLAAETGLEEG